MCCRHIEYADGLLHAVLIFLILAAFFGAVAAGAADRRYNVGGLAVSDDGHVFAAVNTARAAMTIRYDASGDREWCIEETGDIELSGIALDSGGNVITVSFFPFEVTKRSRFGKELWRATVPDVRACCAFGDDIISIDGNDNVFVSADRFSDYGDSFGPAPVKFSPSGEVLWIGERGEYKQPIAIKLDMDGGVLVVGLEVVILDPVGPHSACEDVGMAMKFSPNGKAEWHDYWRGQGLDVASFPGGGAVVTGLYCPDESEVEYVGVIRYTADGDAVWIATPAHTRNFGGRSVVTDVDGNVFVGGDSSPLAAFLVKLDADGNELWSRTYNGPSHQGAGILHVALDPFGYVLVSGVIWDTAVDTQIFAAKYDVDGHTAWVLPFPRESPGDDYYPHTMTVDGDGDIYVGGTRDVGGDPYNQEIILLKLDPGGNVLWTDEIDDTTPCIPPEEDADDDDDDLPCGCGG